MQENVIGQKASPKLEPYKIGQFDAYLTYRALGGLITSDDGRITKMTPTEFCEIYDVGPKTLWRWKNTPGFAEKLEARRNEITPSARVTAVFNQLYLMCMQSQDKRAAVDAQKTFLGHFGNLQLPTQRQDVTVHGGLADVLRAAVADGIIEGEIVDPADLDAGTSSQTPELL